MATSAMVYNVVVASPGDVSEERLAVRDSIHAWNSMHSEQYNLLFTPKMWELDSTPDLSDRGQNIINKQIIHKSDIMIAMFWTRLGSPTGDFQSGTVEEITQFINQKKTVGLFFSNRNIPPSKIDIKQLTALNEYREIIKTQGLIDEFSDVPELSQKIIRFLTVKAIEIKEANNKSTLSFEQKSESPLQVERDEFKNALGRASGANSDGHWLGIVCDYGEGYVDFQSKEKKSIINWANRLSSQLQIDVNVSNARMGEDYVRICVPTGSSPTDFILFYQNTGILTIQWRKEAKSISLAWVLVRCILALRLLLNEGLIPNRTPVQTGFTLSHAPEDGIQTKGVFECIPTHSNYQFQTSIWKSVCGEPIEIDKFIKDFIGRTLGSWGYLDFEEQLEHLQINQSLTIFSLIENDMAYKD